jgi:hypothetical protein
VLGKVIVLNGNGYVIVGVMPQQFQFAPFWATKAELWVPGAFGPGVHAGGEACEFSLASKTLRR